MTDETSSIERVVLKNVFRSDFKIRKLYKANMIKMRTLIARQWIMIIIQRIQKGEINEQREEKWRSRYHGKECKRNGKKKEIKEKKLDFKWPRESKGGGRRRGVSAGWGSFHTREKFIGSRGKRERCRQKKDLVGLIFHGCVGGCTVTLAAIKPVVLDVRIISLGICMTE